MSLQGRIHDVRHALKRRRKALWEAIKERHEAQRGGRRRRKLAREVKRIRGEKDHLSRKLEHLEKKKDKPPPQTSGVVTFDGKPCAAWIAADLRKIREMGWDGYLLSGYRTPAYSESLCYGICGAPSCPGRCAGSSSNHSQYERPGGAADLDPAHIGQALSAAAPDRLAASQLNRPVRPQPRLGDRLLMTLEGILVLVVLVLLIVFLARRI